MARVALGIVLVALQLLGIHGWEACYEYSSWYGTPRYFDYCEAGCCGYTYDRECCDEVDYSSLVGIIIGAVIGGIIFIGLIVSLVCCLVCMGMNKQGNRGRVIAPLSQGQGTTNVTYVSSHANWAQPNPNPMVGQTTGYSQYGGTVGTFPQPPPYQNQAPDTAPPEYPTSSTLYDHPAPAPPPSAPRLTPIDGASSQQQLPPSLPPINHGGTAGPKA